MLDITSSRSRLSAVAAALLLVAGLLSTAPGPALAAPPAADLTVEGLQAGPNDNASRLQIRFEVKNAGEARAADFDVTVAGPGVNETRHVGGLKPGQSKEVKLAVAFPTGGGSLAVTADARNAVAEADEGNNTATAALGSPSLAQEVVPGRLCPIVVLCWETPDVPRFPLRQ